ncbi:hypothetical protein WA026_013248 [Henosepilachna vigintioctopunctata]|uniref:Uncharacterized protein n=1 Tax=Henosepilachna vigintioctopunctata TaxID=420089 RepID=A0AAW1UEG7_9CUCU
MSREKIYIARGQSLETRNNKLLFQQCMNSNKFIEEKTNKKMFWDGIESISQEREKRLIVTESKKKKNLKYSECKRKGGKKMERKKAALV